jgi:hypothetical protein
MALIEKQSVKNYWAMARLSGIDAAYSIVITAIALFIAASDAGSALGKLLLRVDQLSFTNSVVTFMLWGVVGIVVYGLVSSLLRALAKVELGHELASEKYVHPETFSRAKFWREELLISATSALGLVLLVAMTVLVVFTILPTATIHLRSLITSGGEGIWPAVASTVLLIIAMAIVIFTYKLWRYRKVMFRKA